MRGYRCLMYKSPAVILRSATSLSETETDARTFSSRCTELQRLKTSVGLHSPCDRCVNTGEFKSTDSTTLCPNCGFFAEPSGTIGFCSKYPSSEKCVLESHHRPFLQHSMRLVAPLVSGELDVAKLDLNVSIVLASLGIIEGQMVATTASDAARELLSELAEQESFAALWGGGLEFIYRGGHWRSARLVRGPLPEPGRKRVFVDANGLRECLSYAAFDEVQAIASNRELEFREAVARLGRPSRARAVVIAALRQEVTCMSNHLLESELLQGLFTQNPRGIPTEQHDARWADFVRTLAVYDLDTVAFGVAAILVRLYSDLMPGDREADVKDAYHFVCAVQHEARAMVSDDGFMLTLPKFVKRVAEVGLVSMSERAAQMYLGHVPPIIIPLW